MVITSLILSPISSSTLFTCVSHHRFSSSPIQCCEDSLGRSKLRYIGSENGLECFPEKKSLVITPASIPRPRRIILVRHGQSEGNVDESVYTRVPDPKIGLTEKGVAEAEECGKKIRKLIESDGADDWKVYFYVSPYKRSLETLRGLGKAFESSRIAGVREEPRLREQDFGNFQDREKMRVEKAMRILYGRFFYRFPNGESAADVYDRITGFRETLRADIDIGRFQPPGQRNPNMNLVIVSHGLTLRVFLMRWYKWTVEQFEGLNNFGNGSEIIMQTGLGGSTKYRHNLKIINMQYIRDSNLKFEDYQHAIQYFRGVRYSLLVHHTPEELREFGLTEAMLIDQEWQKTARPGELNYDCLTAGPSFFTHFDGDNKR